MASPWSPIIFLKLFFLGDFFFSLKRKSRDAKPYFVHVALALMSPFCGSPKLF